MGILFYYLRTSNTSTKNLIFLENFVTSIKVLLTIIRGSYSGWSMFWKVRGFIYCHTSTICSWKSSFHWAVEPMQNIPPLSSVTLHMCEVWPLTMVCRYLGLAIYWCLKTFTSSSTIKCSTLSLFNVTKTCLFSSEMC